MLSAFACRQSRAKPKYFPATIRKEQRARRQRCRAAIKPDQEPSSMPWKTRRTMPPSRWRSQRTIMRNRSSSENWCSACCGGCGVPPALKRVVSIPGTASAAISSTASRPTSAADHYRQHLAKCRIDPSTEGGVAQTGDEPVDTGSQLTPNAADQFDDLTHAFLRLSKLPTYPLDRLNRSGAALWRQACQILFTLQYLGQRKLWERLRSR
jgi:hypothetical protein